MSDPEKPKMSAATRLTHAGRRKEWTGRVVNPPIWRASTHLFETEAERQAALRSNEDGDFFYGRRGAPTQWALADALTQMEPGAAGTVLYPSGVAAISGALMAVLKPGDNLLMTDNAYDPSRSMATGLLNRWGVRSTFFNPLDLNEYASFLRDYTPRAVWLESPGSLTMEVCDVPALAAMAHEAGAAVLIDNTWASALGFPALERGCDIVVQSLSKHVGGHSDLMMGCASAGERWFKRLRHTAQQVGHVVSPDDAALAARGLRTMGVRLDRSTASAARIAHWLSEQPQVAKVLCPMLPSDQGHALWLRDFTGGCGLFSFVLATDDHAASARVVDGLALFGIGYSWGGYESLALPIWPHKDRSIMLNPARIPDGDPLKEGLKEGLRPAIRLSIGLEDPEDLVADLAQALATV